MEHESSGRAQKNVVQPRLSELHLLLVVRAIPRLYIFGCDFVNGMEIFEKNKYTTAVNGKATIPFYSERISYDLESLFMIINT